MFLNMVLLTYIKCIPLIRTIFMKKSLKFIAFDSVAFIALERIPKWSCRPKGGLYKRNSLYM